jgi:hypothetical protein
MERWAVEHKREEAGVMVFKGKTLPAKYLRMLAIEDQAIKHIGPRDGILKLHLLKNKSQEKWP